MIVRGPSCLDICEFTKEISILDENCKKFQEHIKTCPMPRMGPWGRGKKGFGGRKGGPRFGPGPNFGPGHGFGSHFEGGPFGHGPHNFGHGPNFGLGQAFGFL